jgi:hypothetical protein
LLHCQLLPRFELDTDFGAAIQRKATQASAKAAITRERLLPVHCVPSIAVALVGLRGQYEGACLSFVIQFTIPNVFSGLANACGLALTPRDICKSARP